METKTLTFIKSMLLVLLVTSCSNNAEQELKKGENQKTILQQKNVVIKEKSIATKEKMFAEFNNSEIPNGKNTFFEEDIHRYYLTNMLREQQENKERLLKRIEEGDDEAMEGLERLQEEIYENRKIIKALYGMRPVFPFPPMPLPCDSKDFNCLLPLSNIKYLLLSKDVKKFAVKITTQEGKVIFKNNHFFNTDFFGLPVIKIGNGNFKGKVYVKITKNFALTKETITYQFTGYLK